MDTQQLKKANDNKVVIMKNIQTITDMAATVRDLGSDIDKARIELVELFRKYPREKYMFEKKPVAIYLDSVYRGGMVTAKYIDNKFGLNNRGGGFAKEVWPEQIDLSSVEAVGHIATKEEVNMG